MNRESSTRAPRTDRSGTANPPSAQPGNGAGLLFRIIPPGLYAGRSHTLIERSYLVNKRAWMQVFSGFFEPLFFLFSLGFGLAQLVTTVEGPGGPMPYAAFVAPALLAASAMNGAVFEATFNLFFKFKYAKTYDAVLATPLGPVDIAVGEATWCLIRGGIYAGGFIAVMLGFGLIDSPWALLALPACLLVALGFAAIGMAAATYMRSWHDFDLVQLAVMPLFLFSGTFYPLSVYPGWIQAVVEWTPLYHAIELMRALTSGYVGWGALGHVAYFVVMACIGVVVAARRLGKLLLT
ncbi:lipooligosaccharide transport system permease protein [Saccharothrix ecbatanensis]|uniref:Transport permease protein n=1 Tax=Saccharothrix ecbatanensis TaxID=1105145 RepID=A0A7W9M5I9_9PSEU|nr:ABC transporter permease [Saccharothrix ecbatanensis]MBB5808241.1 lipooligosaccharide transport system permease protein [Saccharothrix ecbatanensis]